MSLRPMLQCHNEDCCLSARRDAHDTRTPTYFPEKVRHDLGTVIENSRFRNDAGSDQDTRIRLNEVILQHLRHFFLSSFCPNLILNALY